MRAKYIAAVVLMSAAASPAFAEGYSSPWIFSASIGTEVNVSGDFLSEGTSNSINLTTLNANLTGNGTMNMRGRSFDDIYDPAAKVSLEVRYALSDLAEVFGSASYLVAQAKSGVDLGCMATTAGTCTYGLWGAFSDLKQWTAEIGYRQWFGTGLISDSIRPYYAVRSGITHTDAIHSYVVAGNDPLGHWKLYDKGYSYTLGADLGASYTLGSNAELAAEVGVRYTGKLKADDRDYSVLGLDEINNDASRISVPVSLRFHTAF